jgi:hypothetical protein
MGRFPVSRCTTSLSLLEMYEKIVSLIFPCYISLHYSILPMQLLTKKANIRVTFAAIFTMITLDIWRQTETNVSSITLSYMWVSKPGNSTFSISGSHRRCKKVINTAWKIQKIAIFHLSIGVFVW